MSKKKDLSAEQRAECEAAKALFVSRKNSLGLTQAKVADAAGISPAAVAMYLNGVNPLNAKFASVLARLIGEPVERFSPRLAEEIAGMTAEKRPAATVVEIASNVQGEPYQVRPGRVPVVGKAMLGPDGYFEAMEYPVGHGEGYLNIFSTDENAYGLRVAGHSMKPRIKHNEFVLIEPSKDYVAGDEVLVKTVSGQAMIKEFVYFRDGQYRFDSVNNAFDPIYLTQEEIVFIHYMGAIVKSSRFVEAD